MNRAKEMAVGSILGIGILLAFAVYMIVGCVLGALLVPYNIARIVTWVLEKMVEGVAFILALIEDQI